MLHLYVLYACVHFTTHNPASEAGRTRCVERRVYFQAGECKARLPKGGGLIEKNWHTRRWLECEVISADSWVPGQATGSAHPSYQAIADVSDPGALTALLAPLSAQARATLSPEDLQHSFQRTFQGPGRWSFFIVGTGSTVTSFAVGNLDDFQFTDIATDLSSSGADTRSESLNFARIAEGAGVDLTDHTEMSHRNQPPPGGMETKP